MDTKEVTPQAEEGASFVMKLFEVGSNIKGILVETKEEDHKIGVSYAVHKEEAAVMINLLIDGERAEESLFLPIDPPFKDKILASFATIPKAGQASTDGLAERYSLCIYNTVRKAMVGNSELPDILDEKGYITFLESGDIKVAWSGPPTSVRGRA